MTRSGLSRSRVAVPLVLLGAALGGSPVSADRLMTRDGAVLETAGPWEVRGNLVVFRLPDGTLTSIRLEDADLDASRELAEDRERTARRRAAAAAARTAVLDTVARWADAWSGRRVEEYLSFYAAEFQPPAGMSPAEWRARRRARLAGPEHIELEIGAVRIVALGPGHVRASFVQSYRADHYQDEVLKSLELVRRLGGWRIVREEAGQLTEARARLVLTDRDVDHVKPEDAGAEGGPGEGREGGVRVASWLEEPGPAGTDRLIKGSLRNGGGNRATELAVRALFYGDAGVLIAAHDVPLEEVELGPGSELDFELLLESPPDYRRVAFQVSGRGIRPSTQSFEPPEPSEAEEPGEL